MCMLLLPKTTEYIITGEKALYLQGVISFNPSKFIAMVMRGSQLQVLKTDYPNGIFKTQVDALRNGFVEEIDKRSVHLKERLLVEIDAFNMDAILKKEAIKNLYKICDPVKVRKVILFFKKNNLKMKPSHASLIFLDIKEIDFNNITKDNAGQFLREYLMNKIYESGVVHLIKGGSVVGAYIGSKRVTKDIDGYYAINEHDKLLKFIQESKDNLTFNAIDFNNNNFNNISEYKRARMIVSVKSRKLHLNKIIKDITITLDVDYSFDSSRLNNIIKEYKIKPRKLWKQNRMFLPITQEMTIVEKIVSVLDSQNKNTWRSKDMMDIFTMLTSSNKKIETALIIKWFIFK